MGRPLTITTGDRRRAFLDAIADTHLSPRSPGATINNPNYYRSRGTERIITRQRRQVHDRIIKRWHLDTPQPVAGTAAVVMAGPSAVGKSGLHNHITAIHDEADGSRWRRVDADDFKQLLIEHEVAAGAIDRMLPPAVWEAARAGVGDLRPLELSALVHVESTELMARALRESVEAGENLVIDGTLSYLPWAHDIATQLSDAGYRIHLVAVTAPLEIAQARAAIRHRRGTDADPDGLGGRYLPPAAVAASYDPTGNALGETNALRLTSEYGAVVRYDHYAVADAAAPPILQCTRERAVPGGQLFTSYET